MNFVCDIVDVAGIEPALQIVHCGLTSERSYVASPICLTISRPIERLRVIYRYAPTYASRLLLAEFITIPRPSVATYAAKLCAHSLILLG